MNLLRNIWNLLKELYKGMEQSQREMYEYRIEFIQKHGFDPIPDHLRDIFF